MQISRNQKSIAVSLAIITVTLVFLFLVLLPLIEKYGESLEMIKKINTDRDKVTGTVNTIPHMLAEKRGLEQDFIRLNNRLPAVDKVPEIIQQISDKTSPLKVQVLSMASGDSFELAGRPVIARTIFVDLQSDFETLSHYLKLIETIETALAIKKVFVNRTGSLSPPLLDVKIQVETYMAQDGKGGA